MITKRILVRPCQDAIMLRSIHSGQLGPITGRVCTLEASNASELRGTVLEVEVTDLRQQTRPQGTPSSSDTNRRFQCVATTIGIPATHNRKTSSIFRTYSRRSTKKNNSQTILWVSWWGRKEVGQHPLPTRLPQMLAVHPRVLMVLALYCPA